jgi:hypothetical protein
VKFGLVDSKRYGFLLSGGLDSAVLLGLMLQELPHISIQPFTIPKTDGAALYVQPILDFFNKRFNTLLPNTIHVGDPTVHHRSQSRTAVEEIWKKHDVDFLYNAVNQNPPILNNDPYAPQRDTKSSNPKIVLPFVSLLKDDVLKLMYENGLEELVDMTHSCTEWKVGRCGKCWQCRERQWAFDEIGKIDTGLK